jgi:double-strand break repair protein MRE11
MLISTDNHLGYAEKDPVRGEDSFRTFQEILQIARDRQVDLMLLAGDLFHENKPSRKTLYQTMALLRNYCMGDGAVAFQIVSDQSINFPNFGTVNYEDPNFNIELPIFSIHGNHDDPSREAGFANSHLMNQSSSSSLAALDLLSAANFVNYFGKSDKVDAIEVFPILMCKGTTKIAIYGLGNMRDERLHRMFAQQKVVFRRPQENADEWFNIFVVHQNRDDKGRGKKNCLPESFIPDFIDFVIWGHEHECQIDVNESVHGDFYITQPGSSVATSLIEGEAKQKHIGLLEVQGHQFRMQAIELKSVRPFCIEEIILSEIETLNPNDPNVSEEITKVLSDKVEEMLQQHSASRNISSTSNSSNTSQTQSATTNEILVRLRVEHSGFPVLHNQRFGGRFVGRVANPNDILLFYRRKARVVSMQDADGKNSKKKNLLADPIRPVRNDTVTIEDLMKEQLKAPEKRLHFLPEGPLALALEEYVVKNIPSALDEFVDQVLEDTQKELVAKKQCQSTQDLREAIEKKQARDRAKDDLNLSVQKENNDNQDEGDNMDEDAPLQDEDEYMEDVGRTKSRASSSTSASAPKSESIRKKRTKKQRDLLSSSDEEFQLPSPTKRRRRASSPAAATTTTTTPASRRFGAPRSSNTKPKTPPASKAKKKILSSFEDDKKEDNQDRLKEDDSMDAMDLDEEENNKPLPSARKPPLVPSSASKTSTNRRGGGNTTNKPQQEAEINLCSSSEEEAKSTSVKKRKTSKATTDSKKQPTIAQMFSSQSQAAQSQSQSQFQPLEFANRSRRKSALAAAQAVQQVAEEERQHADSMRDVLSDHDGDSDFTQDKEDPSQSQWSHSESQSQALHSTTSTATKKRRKLPLSMFAASQNSQNSQRPSSNTINTTTPGSAVAARRAWGRTRR